LPFGVLDTDAANQAFLRWHKEQREEDERIINLWTYCYIRYYFLAKFLSRSYGGPADVEELIDKAYRRVEARRHTVDAPSRYANWVSVVVRNLFLNYTRSVKRQVTIDSEDFGPTLVAEDMDGVTYDASYAHRVVREAIERLPPFLQDVARLSLLHNLSYEAISARTDRPVATVRTYMHRSLKKLRDDPGLEEAVANLLDDAPDPTSN